MEKKVTMLNWQHIKGYRDLLFALLGWSVVWLSPLIVARYVQVESYGIVLTFLFVLPLLGIIALLKWKWFVYVFTSVFTISSLVEMAMVAIGHQWFSSGMVIACLHTTQEETMEVIKHSYNVFGLTLLLLFIHIGACVLWHFALMPTKKYRYAFFIVTMLCSGALYGVKAIHINYSLIYWYEDIVLSRPPYNFLCQFGRGMSSIWRQHKMQTLALELDDFRYGAKRLGDYPDRESYIVIIGESMRYENLSLAGYEKTTTPNLEKIDNLVLFSDYYSTSCLTMYSVPLMLTPGTPNHFDDTYRCRSILAPYQEIGFKTYVIVTRGQFLSQKGNSHLTMGADSVIVVSNDSCIVSEILTIVSKEPKTFILCEIWGSHHPYFNVGQTQNLPQDMEIGSLLERYDATIHYTDQWLSSLMLSLAELPTCIALCYVSDHGESISEGKVGHGIERVISNPESRRLEYHVPLIYFWNEKYSNEFPDVISRWRTEKDNKINANGLFVNMLQMADIQIDNKDKLGFMGGERSILLNDGEHWMEVP